jgi:crotonobetainyl-CoA:carnitine CoA-transferase CaiB-like acyl-CoA transferase
MWEPRAINHLERNQSMAEITRPGPLAGVPPIDFATVVMGPYAALIFGVLGADVIPLGELSEHPQVHKQLIEAVEKTYGSYSYAEPSEERDASNSPCKPH